MTRFGSRSRLPYSDRLSMLRNPLPCLMGVATPHPHAVMLTAHQEDPRSVLSLAASTNVHQ